MIRLGVLLLAVPCLAAGPLLPCGEAVLPAYSELNRPPATQAWERGAWEPPACTGWKGSGYTTLAAVAARFRFDGSSEGLLGRIGAITSTKGVEYWSTTHQRWQTLVVNAFALSASTVGTRRADFKPDELSPGRRVYFEQEDNLSGKGVYELHVIEVSPDRIVFETRNLTTLRYLMVPVFHPGDVESIYFLEREGKDVWRYYNLARIGENANSLASGHAASAVNRAEALYRHLARLPAH